MILQLSRSVRIEHRGIKRRARRTRNAARVEIDISAVDDIIARRSRAPIRPVNRRARLESIDSRDHPAAECRISPPRFDIERLALPDRQLVNRRRYKMIRMIEWRDALLRAQIGIVPPAIFFNQLRTDI